MVVVVKLLNFCNDFMGEVRIDGWWWDIDIVMDDVGFVFCDDWYVL